MADILRETKNPCVMWGDLNLLHAAADRAAMKDCHPIDKCKRVLDALARNAKGDRPLFRMRRVRVQLSNGWRKVRAFDLVGEDESS